MDCKPDSVNTQVGSAGDESALEGRRIFESDSIVQSIRFVNKENDDG